MAQPRIGKSAAERAALDELAALAGQYDGPVTRLPAGEARADQIKAPQFLPPPPPAPNGNGGAGGAVPDISLKNTLKNVRPSCGSTVGLTLISPKTLRISMSF